MPPFDAIFIFHFAMIDATPCRRFRLALFTPLFVTPRSGAMPPHAMPMPLLSRHAMPPTLLSMPLMTPLPSHFHDAAAMPLPPRHFAAFAAMPPPPPLI
jgi:hypothetical protein